MRSCILPLAAALVLLLPAGSRAEGPVVGPDHVVVSVPSLQEAQRLHRVFTGDLGLPSAWPVQKYGNRISGGIFLGNFNLELAVWPQVDPNQLLGLALAVRNVAAFAELRQRGLTPREQEPVQGTLEYWRNANVTQLAGEGLGIFLCRYNPDWIAPLQEEARRAFAAAGGGRAGVMGAAGVEVVANGARREALLKLLAPAEPGALTPAIVLVDGQRFQIRSVTVKCKDPDKAKAALPADFPVVFIK